MWLHASYAPAMQEHHADKISTLELDSHWIAIHKDLYSFTLWDALTTQYMKITFFKDFKLCISTGPTKPLSKNK